MNDFLASCFVLDEDTMLTIIKRVNPQFDEAFDDLVDAMLEANIDHVNYRTGFCGDAYHAVTGQQIVRWDYDVVFYVYLDHQPSLFKAAYANIDEAAAEIRSKIGNYLPADYDFSAHIVELIGTIYD